MSSLKYSQVCLGRTRSCARCWAAAAAAAAFWFLPVPAAQGQDALGQAHPGAIQPPLQKTSTARAACVWTQLHLLHTCRTRSRPSPGGLPRGRFDTAGTKAQSSLALGGLPRGLLGAASGTASGAAAGAALLVASTSIRTGASPPAFSTASRPIAVPPERSANPRRRQAGSWLAFYLPKK